MNYWYWWSPRKFEDWHSKTTRFEWKLRGMVPYNKRSGRWMWDSVYGNWPWQPVNTERVFIKTGLTDGKNNFFAGPDPVYVNFADLHPPNLCPVDLPEVIEVSLPDNHGCKTRYIQSVLEVSEMVLRSLRTDGCITLQIGDGLVEQS